MSKRRIGERGQGSSLAAAFALAGVLALGACSSWFTSNSGEKIIEPEKADAKTASGPDVKAAAQKADSEGYPNLADVPKRPPVTPPDQRIIIEEGLLADRANARYTNQQPRWASDTGNSSAYVPPGSAKRPQDRDSKMTPAPREAVSEVPAAGGETRVASAANPAMAASAQVGAIVFAENSSAVPSGGAAVLQQVAAAYKASGGTLRVVGHTNARQLDADPEKDRIAKFDLSLARANAVAAELVKLGVERDTIVTAGVGDSAPAAPPDDAARAAENARVDVFLDKQERPAAPLRRAITVTRRPTTATEAGQAALGP
jgi:outer membrane protein OmpA-like peptidoglycan-associated protein